MAALDSRCAQEVPDDDDDAEGEIFDYEYGDQEQPEGCWPPAEEDLGYEDVDVCSPASNQEGFDSDTSPPGVSTSTRPRRRCSITKFSLESATPLNAASVINDFRNNPVLIATTTTCDQEDLPAKVSSEHRHNNKEFSEESTHATTCHESSASSSSSSSVMGEDAAAAVMEEQLPSQHSTTQNKTRTDSPIIGIVTTPKKKFLARFFHRPSRKAPASSVISC